MAHADRVKGAAFPAALVGLLFVFLVPLPTAILDLLLVINLTLSVILLVSVVYVKSPLELASFPSVLLAVTLFRLVLNVATTRLILTAGDGVSNPDEALHSAGDVIQTFSSFVTGDKIVVGLIIFVIIFVIQFVVITKGSTRISEVAARFTLDAMPGKQMAIDADLNAGAIDETEARKRRENIGQEADFYASMDGASKFVRGDAIAGIVITLVNIVGGIFVGMTETDWAIGDIAGLFTRLTIGDGLVSQVPAFVVSLAAGLLVTRSSSREELGNEIITQVFDRPKALVVAAGFLVVMSVTGLPAVPMLVLGAGCGGVAYLLTRRDNKKAEAATRQESAQAAAAVEPPAIEDQLSLDALELEVGGGLIAMCDPKRQGELLPRITSVRQQLAIELGIVVPSVRIRDNVQLEPTEYVVKLRGATIARGETFPEQYMAMDSGTAAGPITAAEPTTEPAFGLPAYWITEPQREEAEVLNYTVVDAVDVLSTHLAEVLKRFSHELLTRQNVRDLLDKLKETSPALVEEVVPELAKPGDIQKVMQNLLRERVPVRDLETIVETIGDYAGRTTDASLLTEVCRHALARTICKQYVDEQDKLWCVTLDPAVEQLIRGHTEEVEQQAPRLTMPAQTQQTLVTRIAEKVEELAASGRPGVLLVDPAVRQAVREVVAHALPHVAVLGYGEVVQDVDVEAVGLVSMNA
jgi:flagellar biosynthesis protein FlhA